MLPLETKHFYSQLICFSVLSYFIVLRKKNNLKTFQILVIPYKLKKKKKTKNTTLSEKFKNLLDKIVEIETK